MPEADTRDDKSFHEDIPPPEQGFFLKGSGAYDWGMKNRLARIFSPQSGRTVMLAIDHGYFQGPTTGLERIDVAIPPLLLYSDTLMLTRGVLRSTISPNYTKGLVLRASGGPSILKELSNEQIAVGKKIPELDALKMAHRALQEGALGVDMGRNIFQSEHPVAMIQAVRKVVHEGERPEAAYDFYRSLSQKPVRAPQVVAR